MKNKVFDLTSRVSDKKYEIDDQLYLLMLFKAIHHLYLELQSLMEKEGRKFGIVISYFNSIDKASSFIDIPIENDLSGNVLYLLKPVFRSEYNRLINKKLSPADADICILNKLLSIIGEKTEFAYNREVKTISKIINKLYTNIKTYSKKDPLFFMGDLIRRCINEKTIGKYSSDIFRFNTESTEKEKFTGNNVQLVTGEKNKIFELDL